MDKFVIKAIEKTDANESDGWLSSKKSQKPKSQPTLPSSSKEKREKKPQVKREAVSQEESASTSRNSDIAEDCKKVMKKLWTPTFKSKYEKIALESFNKEKDAEELKTKGVVRDAEVRSKLMHGYDCRCCAPYYDALGLSPAERQKRINEISRHRAFEPIPPTPERYWDVQFPDENTQMAMGAVHISNTPILKPTKFPRKPLRQRNEWAPKQNDFDSSESLE